MKLDDNPQMVAMLDHAKGSLENKIRQAYNSGYNDGFKAGVFEAWDDMREQLNKSLRQQIEQTEPQLTEKCPFDDSLPCEWVCTEYGKCKYRPKDEPQTERSE